MGWICSECSSYNEDGFDKCIVCDAARPPFVEVRLTKTAVSSLRLKDNVIIPIDYNVIGENAFINRTDITGLVLHENVKIIEKGAFSGCSNLKEIISYAFLDKICTKAFYNCTSLPEDQRVVAEYLAADAYGTTLDDLMTSSTTLADGEHEDAVLSAAEEFIDTTPLMTKIAVSRDTSASATEEPMEVLVEKNYLALDTPASAPDVARVTEATYPLLRTDTAAIDRTITRRAVDLKPKKTLYQIFADVSTAAFFFFVIATLFFFVANYVNLFDNSQIYLSISAALILPFLIFSLCHLLSIRADLDVAMIVNSVIGALLSGASIASYFFFEGLFVFAISISSGFLLVAAGLLVSSYFDEYYDFSDFPFTASLVMGCISLVSAVMGIIFYFNA